MTESKQRPALSRERILQAALALADEIGIEPFTIRRLATALDVGAMTIYHYIPSKEEIIDGMVDAVFAKIALPPTDLPWQEAIKVRTTSAREVITSHPWAPPLMETRTSPGPATLAHHDAMVACFRNGGLSLQLTAHAYAIVDSFLYGFTLQEATLPGSSDEEFADVAAAMLPEFEEAFPHLAEFTARHVLQPGYSFGDSFEFGLDILLDGLSAKAAADAP